MRIVGVMDRTYDVAIIGAGPVGLTLALGLARRGVTAIVLERDDDTAEHSRAPAIWPPTQRILAELGVLDSFVEAGIIVRRLTLHDADADDGTLLTLRIEELADETDHPQLLIVPQSRTERLLCQAVRAAGTEVRFGAEAVEVVQDSTGVTVRYRTGSGEQELRARLVAGCDGASSRVRELIGASFDGVTYDARAALADLRVPGHDDLAFPRLTTRPTLAIAIRIDAGLWRLILPIAAGDERPLDTRVADAARALLPASGETVWQSDFRLHRRISSKLADGRIALAGDAAHLNSPVGGQGMNAGMADAAALAGALEYTLRIDSTAPLADYARRRRDAVETGVNAHTDRLTRVLLAHGGRLIRPALRAGRLLLAVPPLRRRFLRSTAMLDTV
jgi:3-(3-hydroxy-phenyl)propionate hydroxylase